MDEGLHSFDAVLDRASQTLRWEPQKIVYSVVETTFPEKQRYLQAI